MTTVPPMDLLIMSANGHNNTVLAIGGDYLSLKLSLKALNQNSV